jgi:hypothetical protein
MRSLYFCRMRSASALRFSNGCSSLNFERMATVGCVVVGFGVLADGICIARALVVECRCEWVAVV